MCFAFSPKVNPLLQFPFKLPALAALTIFLIYLWTRKKSGPQVGACMQILE